MKIQGGAGRLLEGTAVLVLLLIVLTFGISIASRFLPGDEPPAGSTEEAAAPEAPERYDSRVHERTRVEVLNGCGLDGLARRMGLRLRAEGFDVVEWRDANRYDYSRTLVLATERHREAAVGVRDFLQGELGVGELQIQESPGSLADVQVILGADMAETPLGTEK
jgi:hypothetical protein